MASTKATEKTVQEIEAKLKNFGGDMVKIEYLENCLRNILQNDAKRFCHLRLAELYASRLMWHLAGKNMAEAADCATSFKEKVDLHLKEIMFWVKISDSLMIDRAFKNALMYAAESEKSMVKEFLRKEMITRAEEHEKRGKRSNAVQIYERLISMPIISEEERKQLIEKIAVLDSRLGRLKDAMRYEDMLKKPFLSETSKRMEEQSKKDAVKKISFEELGIDSV